MAERKGPPKSNLWKWALGCGCAALILGGLGVAALVAGGFYIASRTMTFDPDAAKTISDGIFASELPDGYEMKFGMNVLVYKMVVFGPKQEGQKGPAMAGFVMQVSETAKMDRKAMEAELDKQAQKNANRKQGKVESSEEITVTVGSEEVPAVRQVLIEGSAKKIQYSIFLQKPGGNFMIILTGPEDNFDEDGMESYLESIKFAEK